MADLKISQLTGASTPLAGTEVLPIVQSGSTVKVSIANLTAGRAVASAGGTFSDNFVQGTAAKGVNFTANTGAAGMTSQLLNWYEEGTFTPTMTSASGTTTVNTATAQYTRIGDHVYVILKIDYTTNASVSTANFTIGGLPFTSRSTFTYRGFVTSSNWTASDYNDGYITIGSSATSLVWAGRAVDQSSRTNAILMFVADYFTA